MLDRWKLSKSQRWAIANRLAAQNLPSIDEGLEEVKPSTTLYARYGKRVVDLAVSSLALVVTLPINLTLAVGAYLDVGRPIIFHQERAGKDGVLFTIVKFRSMTNARDSSGELLPASERVTKWGSFVRKTSLDELFNFWSIFKGDMSVIGPRPLPPEYVHRYNKRHRGRLLVRPGLECPPRDKLNHVFTWQEQFENDVWYVEHVSFATDLKMLINLVRFALDARSAEARALVKSKGTFMGYSPEGKAINLAEVPQELIDEVVLGEESEVREGE